MDIVLAMAALLALAPLLLGAALAIALETGLPVLFRQTRVGLNGREFGMYKFRSMVKNAAQVGPYFTTDNDPRITRVGRFVRRTSIDELPQLFNVVLGDMSLIGPRPHPVALDVQYTPLVAGYMRRYSVRPGMSGLAQVSGHRGPTPTVDAMAARVAHDLRYIEDWTIGLDVRILVRTVIPWWSEVRGGS